MTIHTYVENMVDGVVERILTFMIYPSRGIMYKKNAIVYPLPVIHHKNSDLDRLPRKRALRCRWVLKRRVWRKNSDILVLGRIIAV